MEGKELASNLLYKKYWAEIILTRVNSIEKNI